MRTPTKIFAMALVAVLTCVASIGRAQPTAPTQPSDATTQKPPKTSVQMQASETDVLVMSPFEVMTEKDTGYIAADTLNAGRLSTNLLMTPGNFDVMTRDFINDLGAFNIDEASGWLTNARPLENGAIEGNSMNPGSFALSDSGTNVTLRGVATNPSTRNYFTSGSTPKEYNVERVESARGPNAIIYGEGGPGGSVTTSPNERKATTSPRCAFGSTTLGPKARDWISIASSRKSSVRVTISTRMSRSRFLTGRSTRNSRTPLASTIGRLQGRTSISTPTSPKAPAPV
jgi:outer membrane receptor protein involved in Fe transport